ncbi:hypothetical protein ACMDCR_15195 [Labrys okinawensis]|uniref:hypothetical protein n=1 Tax=Labrys okinawensis TaxID=346911 RepID=UPI0039BCE1D1
MFSLAIFALPAFIGVNAGLWAHTSGAGIVGGIIVGLLTACATFGAGHLLLAFLRPTWAKLLIAFAFMAPAAIAGYAATHGIVKHLMPSDGWQMAFSCVGAIAISITALIRLAGMTAADATDRRATRGA